MEKRAEKGKDMGFGFLHIYSYKFCRHWKQTEYKPLSCVLHPIRKVISLRVMCASVKGLAGKNDQDLTSDVLVLLMVMYLAVFYF